MQVQTTNGSRIRTRGRSSIHFGGTAIRCGNRMTFGTADRCNKVNNSLYNQMASENEEFDGDAVNENMSQTCSIGRALTEEGKMLYSGLKNRDKRKYERYFDSKMSNQNWTSYKTDSTTFNDYPLDNNYNYPQNRQGVLRSSPKTDLTTVRGRVPSGNKAKSVDGTGRSVIDVDAIKEAGSFKVEGNRINIVRGDVCSTKGDGKSNKNDKARTNISYRNRRRTVRFVHGKANQKGAHVAANAKQKAAQKAVEASVVTTQKAVATTTKTVARATSGVAVGAATFGVGTVVMAATDVTKTAIKTARQITNKMQQQVSSEMQAQQEMTVAQTKMAAGEEEQIKREKTSSAIMLFLAAAVITMLISSVSILLIISLMMQSQTPQNNCTKLAEAAQEELKDADMTVGGYRYKNWYGMDANWCAMFVSYCSNKCGFIDSGVMPKTASVAVMKQWYIDHGQFKDKLSGYEPKAGDVIIFGNGMSHVGIVTGYDSETKTVTTIEGNSGRSSTSPYHKGSHVKEHHYPLNYAKIAGYGTPAYPTEDNKMPQQPTENAGENTQ